MNAQDEVIKLSNSGFEDRPHQGTFYSAPIKGWFDCGKINFPGETPPDIHPNGYWENDLPASEGDTYLGMVVRDNGTYEAMSVRLNGVLKADQCYKFSIHLARAEKYVSQSRMTRKETNYTQPIVLRIWGGNGLCHERELLAESKTVNNTSWQINTFEFRPKQDVTSLTLSAYYKTPTFFPYNGNVLVDGASDIVRIPCPEDKIEEIVADNTAKRTTPKSTPKTKSPKNNGSTTSKNDKTATSPKDEIADDFKPEILQDLSKDKIKTGQVIEIKNLLFAADSSRINKSSYPVLDEIYRFLMATPKVVIEIGGHTNNVPPDEYCNSLSTARAKSVAQYLVDKGVDPSKIQFKGYGKKKPIADNNTAIGRLKNQRVELKILNYQG